MYKQNSPLDGYPDRPEADPALNPLVNCVKWQMAWYDKRAKIIQMRKNGYRFARRVAYDPAKPYIETINGRIPNPDYVGKKIKDKR